MLTLALIAAVATAAPPPPEALARAMTGVWTSAEQAKATPGYDVIRTTIVRLPNLSPDDTASLWLFTESAYEAKLDKPYRRTATRLTTQADGRVRIASFRLKAPDRAVPGVTAADLAPLEGCDATFTRTAGGFEGAMAPKACRNHYKGADWLDSRTTVTADALVTWDRGMTDAGVRVWGPEAGGYRFRRMGVARGGG